MFTASITTETSTMHMKYGSYSCFRIVRYESVLRTSEFRW